MPATVLHIDDEPLSAEVALELRSHGHNLIEIDDREVALRMVQDGVVDLVVGETKLIHFDGLELLGEIRACDDKLPILVLTLADRTPELYAEALEHGVGDFLTKPALDSQLSRTILELVSSDGEAADGREDDGSRESAGPDTGDLDEVPVPEILRRLRFEGYTGICIVSGGHERLGIQLRNGSIVAISVKEELASIEDFVLHTGRITPQQHAALLDQVTAGIGTARETLIGMGALSEDELARAERDRIEERLFKALTWDTGSYRFLPGKKLKTASTIEFAVSPLLLRGTLHEADAGRAAKALARRGRLYASSGDAPDAALASELGAPEREILETLDGDRTLSEILDTGKVEAHSLYGLWLAGAIELHSDPILVLDEILVAPAGPDALGEDAPASPSGSPDVATDALHSRLSKLHDQIHSQNNFDLLDVAEKVEDEEVRLAHERLLDSLPSATQVAAFPPLVSLLRKIHARIEKAHTHLADRDSRRAYSALLREEKRERDAKAAGERALEAEEWFRKGEKELELNGYDQAVEAFGMAAHHRPEEGDYLAHLGYAMYLANPDEDMVMREAMEHVAKGIKLSPEREKPYLYLARIFKQMGNLKSAARVYRQAVRIDPECVEARRELRRMEQTEKKPKGIMRLLRKH